jgi:hypothetical protein
LCPDGKNHAVLRSFRLVPGLYLDSDFLPQPAFTQQRLLNYTAGPLAQILAWVYELATRRHLYGFVL